jgi:hypothetical protein
MLYVIVESINCDGESLQEKNDIMQNIVAATIEEAGKYYFIVISFFTVIALVLKVFLFYSIGSKSMVQVANSLLDGLQIDTTTPLEVRQPLFDSNCGDNESGIAIALFLMFQIFLLHHFQMLQVAFTVIALVLKLFLFYSIGSKSMVQVANSLLDGLQIDTITPLEVRQPLFDSNCGDIESGIAIAMGYASPSASIVDSKFFLFPTCFCLFSIFLCLFKFYLHLH